jgi:hypothetical protein
VTFALRLNYNNELDPYGKRKELSGNSGDRNVSCDIFFYSYLVIMSHARITEFGI